MKLRVLLGTLALSLAMAALVPTSAEAASPHSRHRRPAVRVYETYRSPHVYDYRYDRYDRRYDRYDDRYDRYDPYYYDDRYYRSYSPRIYVPVPVYRPYRYYRPYRPLIGVRVGGPRFGVWLGW